MRPLQIMDKPMAAPHVCINCGAGVERQFFVDLGFDSSMEKIQDGAKYWTEGVIYLCSECISSIIVEFNRKLPDFLRQQFIARGFLMDANTDEIRTLQNEIFMLRDQLNLRDEEVQTLRYRLLSAFEQENEVLSPPEPTAPTADELVNKMLGTDTDGSTSGSDAANDDGHDSSSAGDDSSAESNDSDSASDEHDSLAATHLSLGSIGATFPPSN